MTITPAHELRRETEAARVLLASYADVIGDDEIAKTDAVEGETNLLEAFRPVMVRIAEIEAMCAGIKAMADKLDARKHRLEEQAKTLRTLLLTGMETAGLKRFEADVGTLARKPTAPAAVVTNEAEVPAEFWKRGEPKLDKKALLAALKAAHEEGKTIPGAQLSNGGATVQLTWN